MSKVPKEIIRTRLFIGIAGAVFLYVGLRYYIVPKYFKPSAPATPKANFVNATGQSDFVAKRYDANHVNKNGTIGATWIAFKDSDIVGYWENGKIPLGTPINL